MDKETMLILFEKTSSKAEALMFVLKTVAETEKKIERFEIFKIAREVTGI